MAVTRKQLADTIDEYDQQIAELQAGKRETYQSYREELIATAGKDAAKAEIDAFKVALKRRQAIAKKGEEAIEDKDALADEIFVEITLARAPRATRTRESDLVTTRIQNNSGALEPKTGVSSTTPDPHTNSTARETLASTTAADPAGEADDASSADQSTAARSDVLGDEGKAGVSPAPDRTLAELEVAPPAGDQAEPGAGDATADAAPPVDTKSQEHPELGSDVLRDSLAGVEGDADRQPIHQSTAPRSDVGDNSTEASGPGQRLDPAAATTPPAGETPPVDTVLLQEGDVEAEGQGRVTREQGSGEPSQPLLPNGRVENKPDGPAVTVAAPISATHHGGSGAIPETAAAPVAEGVSPNASSVTPFLAITAGGQAIEHQGAVS